MSLKLLKGVELKKITNFLEAFAPIHLAESWDNTGLLVEPIRPKTIENILLTNDLTEDVVMEALDLNIGLIISYHPPIFKPLTKITSTTWKEKIIGTCIENKIAIYSPHTSWDSVPGGVNDWLAGAFDIEISSPIKENININIANAGAGRYCKLKQEITLCEAIENVKKRTSLKFLQLALARDSTLDTVVKDIAICAGSGSSVLNNVKADLYLSGEMSHHDLLNAIHHGTNVLLCNHSNSERGFLKEFAVKLEGEFKSYGVNIFLSKKDKDPVQIV